MQSYWWEEVMTIVSIPIYGILIGAELLISNLSHLLLYKSKDTLNNIFFTILNLSIDTLLRGVFLFYMAWAFQFKIIHWSNNSIIQVVYWILIILLTDLMYWFVHWLGHTVRLFWAVHVIHHSSQEFNVSVGFRSSVFEPIYRGLFFIPLALFGFNAADIMLAFAIQQLYGSLIHTKLINQLGFIEKIMVTPSHHRVHHGSNVPYLDKNMGMIFIFWDKLFRTFTPEKEKVVYGLTTNYNFYNPIKILFFEFNQIIKDTKLSPVFKHKLMYVFGPPGWSHNGTTKTSKQLQSTK